MAAGTMKRWPHSRDAVPQHAPACDESQDPRTDLTPHGVQAWRRAHVGAVRQRVERTA